MNTQAILHVRAYRDGVLSRRTFVKTLAGAGTAGVLGWKDAVSLNADELRRQGKSCILLYMRGGPSQLETFDPKPGHANGGPTTSIQTSVEGIRIAENWTNVAREMRNISIIRSMTSREGEHQRATYQMHTGYLPLGGLRYPSLGAMVASEIAPREFELPHFVYVGNRFLSQGAGYLGTAFAPFAVQDANRMPANSELPTGTNASRLNRRLHLMQDLERDFAEAGGAQRVRDHQAIVTTAANMVRSPLLRAFDISQESQATRQRYGAGLGGRIGGGFGPAASDFGAGCLLARRLVEAGVTFVEVDLGNWDTHQDNFERTKPLSERADAGFGALVQDLRERGRLDRTLIIWMGEFGRTPRINGNNGRDHYPRAFSVALAGGGVQGGRVIGSTNDAGTDITQRPVTVSDLFCTFCHALGIDPRKELMTPIGRPIKLVDGGERVRELF